MDLSGPRHPSCGEDVAPYALGALSPEDARRFETHLAGCELCQTDLAALRPVVAALSEAPDPVDPPPDLRRRLMAVVEQEAADRRRAERPQRERRALSPSWRPRALPALAAACALLVTGVGVGIVLSGDDATTVRGIAPAGVEASLRVDDDKGEIHLQNMPAPREGRVMQVWVMRDGSTTPEPTDALFTPNRAGEASVAVPGDLDGVARVLVSEEPRGGSRAPTTAPSLDFRLQSS